MSTGQEIVFKERLKFLTNQKVKLSIRRGTSLLITINGTLERVLGSFLYKVTSDNIEVVFDIIEVEDISYNSEIFLK